MCAIRVRLRYVHDSAFIAGMLEVGVRCVRASRCVNGTMVTSRTSGWYMYKKVPSHSRPLTPTLVLRTPTCTAQQ